MEITIEEIRKALEPYGITEKYLTPEELENFKEELKNKKQGKEVLDGVLSNPAIFYRKVD